MKLSVNLYFLHMSRAKYPLQDLSIFVVIGSMEKKSVRKWITFTHTQPCTQFRA